ncbi:hypothetical protein FHS42_003443 [Streptomyces zagrosensis]|uniref:Transposase n=1 Tax=Streptomyces zagrosensis TaxID=1042984 RepID=A0A7W9Q9Z2_9ACTN|nr:hypothetical protein [Streptomyces zagrosensis]
MHLLEKYGNWRGLHDRLRRRALDGSGERMFTARVAQADANEDRRAVQTTYRWMAPSPSATA